MTAGGGTAEQAEGLVQYGGKAGKSGSYRVFGRYSNLGTSDPAGFAPAADSRHANQGGFRSDWDLSPRDLVTVQGEYRRVKGGETTTGVLLQTPPLIGTFAQPIKDDGGNILGRWTRTFLNGSDISLQAYFDRSDVAANGVHDWSSIGNIDFQHHLRLGSRNDLVWGLGYRAAANRFGGTSLFTLSPPERTDSLYSTFVQDEITLTKTLSLTLGIKLEHNAYTGYENEPSAQLVWAPTNRHTVWISAAKAIRQPSNIDSGLQAISSIVPLPGGAFGLVRVSGNPNAKVEQLRDLETGYRAQINRRLSLDVTGFLSFYKHLQTTEPQTPFFTLSPGPPHLVIPFIFDYKAHARNYGAEAFANWNVTKRWRISPGLTMLNMSVSRDPSSHDGTIQQQPGYSPKRSYQVRSFMNLGRRFEWDQTAGYTSRLTAGIPGYVRLDTRIGRRIGESWELSIAGQNLLTPRHAEFPDSQLIDHMLDQRSIFAKITVRF
jgi:iron complex outermembrane receptor protein